MIAVRTPSMAPNSLPFNWFDITVILILGFGVFRGRKNGMSRELLPTIQWILVVVVSGLAYPFVGQLFKNITSLDRVSCFVLGYLLIAVVVWLLAGIPRHKYADRLAVSNFFGASEFYLGMLSGMVRFACILLLVLAVLNAPVHTEADVLRQDSYDKTNYGGGLYQGSYFPHIYTIQNAALGKSFLGSCVKKYLGPLLVNTVPPDSEKSAAPQTHPVIHMGN
ncbi:MAG: CvpA family protein [Candidatus Acidiferrales bacterium]